MAIDLHKELISLRREILNMGAMVEQRVRRVIEALRDGDTAAARDIRASDAEIDSIDSKIDSECLRVLALGAPVAGDLRFVLTVMRINSELERIGDLCRGIAKRIMTLSLQSTIELPTVVFELAEAALSMLSNALAGLANEDASLCREVRRSDDRADDLNREIFAWCRSEIPRHVEQTSAAIDILSIGQRFERIADIASAIAGEVIFLVEGNSVRHTKV